MNPTTLDTLAELETKGFGARYTEVPNRLGITHLCHLMKGTNSVTEILWPENSTTTKLTKKKISQNDCYVTSP